MADLMSSCKAQLCICEKCAHKLCRMSCSRATLHLASLHANAFRILLIMPKKVFANLIIIMIYQNCNAPVYVNLPLPPPPPGKSGDISGTKPNVWHRKLSRYAGSWTRFASSVSDFHPVVSNLKQTSIE